MRLRPVCQAYYSPLPACARATHKTHNCCICCIGKSLSLLLMVWLAAPYSILARFFTVYEQLRAALSLVFNLLIVLLNQMFEGVHERLWLVVLGTRAVTSATLDMHKKKKAAASSATSKKKWKLLRHKYFPCSNNDLFFYSLTSLAFISVSAMLLKFYKQ